MSKALVLGFFFFFSLTHEIGVALEMIVSIASMFVRLDNNASLLLLW